MQPRYVVDTNVLVHWLLDSKSLAGKIITSLDLELFAPHKALQELWEHKDVWSRKKNSEINLQEFVDAIGSYVKIIRPSEYDRESFLLASSIMNKIDPEDADFLTVALMMHADIWSYNKHFDNLPVSVRRVNTLDLLKMSPSRLHLFEALAEEWTNKFG